MLLDQFSYQSVSCSYVHEILDNFSLRKAVGVDGISPLLLMHATPVVAEEITQLINYLIMNQSWSTEWKNGNPTPERKEKKTIVLFTFLLPFLKYMRS